MLKIDVFRVYVDFISGRFWTSDYCKDCGKLKGRYIRWEAQVRPRDQSNFQRFIIFSSSEVFDFNALRLHIHVEFSL